jgi:hypothetical protein
MIEAKRRGCAVGKLAAFSCCHHRSGWAPKATCRGLTGCHKAKLTVRVRAHAPGSWDELAPVPAPPLRPVEG